MFSKYKSNDPCNGDKRNAMFWFNNILCVLKIDHDFNNPSKKGFILGTW